MAEPVKEMSTVVRPGAEPYSARKGPIGVLLCHGFTGSPASVRPWAEFLAAAGVSVELPLLPGHGTTWQDLQQTTWHDWYQHVELSFDALLERCERVFVMGLSMGGTLTLRLAAQRGACITGVVVVNPSVHSRNRLMPALPVIRHAVRSVPGIKNDVKRPGQDEHAYDRVPLHAMHSLTQLWRVVEADLPSVDQPILVFGSVVDHVVEPSNGTYVAEHVASEDVSYVSLPNSYHVATLDHDAQTIFETSLAFIHRLTPAADDKKPLDGRLTR